MRKPKLVSKSNYTQQCITVLYPEMYFKDYISYALAIASMNENDVRTQDRALLEASRRKIEEVILKKRMTDLIIYMVF